MGWHHAQAGKVMDGLLLNCGTPPGSQQAGPSPPVRRVGLKSQTRGALVSRFGRPGGGFGTNIPVSRVGRPGVGSWDNASGKSGTTDRTRSMV